MRDNLYLVDTSAWLEVLSRGRPAGQLQQRIDALLSGDRIATTGIVRLKLLGGARTESEFSRLEELLSALHLVATTERHFGEASRLGFQLRRQGTTVPFTDLLIAAIAIQSQTILLHRDRHFDLIAGQVPLMAESYVSGADEA